MVSQAEAELSVCFDTQYVPGLACVGTAVDSDRAAPVVADGGRGSARNPTSDDLRKLHPPTTCEELLWNVRVVLTSEVPVSPDDLPMVYQHHTGHPCNIGRFLIDEFGLVATIARLPHVFFT